MPFSLSNRLGAYLSVDRPDCHSSLLFWFLRTWWCVVTSGHLIMFSLGFLTGYPMDICISNITFQYLLFVSFPNISHPFRSIHQIWTDLNLLRMSGFRMHYVVLPALLLILTLIAATFIIDHVCSDSCRCIADLCAVCNAYVVLMVWVHGN